MTARHAIASCTLALEALAAAYLVLVTFLLSGWFTRDDVAVRMSDGDWYRVAAMRFGSAVVLAAVFAIAVFMANRFIAHRIGLTSSWFWKGAAAVVFAAMSLAGLVGSVRFAVLRPFM